MKKNCTTTSLPLSVYLKYSTSELLNYTSEQTHQVSPPANFFFISSNICLFWVTMSGEAERSFEASQAAMLILSCGSVSARPGWGWTIFFLSFYAVSRNVSVIVSRKKKPKSKRGDLGSCKPAVASRFKASSSLAPDTRTSSTRTNTSRMFCSRFSVFRWDIPGADDIP